MYQFNESLYTIYFYFKARDGKWGGSIMLMAMATMSRTNIAYYTNDTEHGSTRGANGVTDNNWRWRIFAPLHTMKDTHGLENNKTIFIRLKNKHYQVVKW